MDPWEIRMRHDRAVVDAFFVMHEQPIPIHPEGACASIPKWMQRKYIGARFVPALSSSGHDHADFYQCCCRRDAGSQPA
jgi:hypothetical protein